MIYDFGLPLEFPSANIHREFAHEEYKLPNPSIHGYGDSEQWILFTLVDNLSCITTLTIVSLFST